MRFSNLNILGRTSSALWRLIWFRAISWAFATATTEICTRNVERFFYSETSPQWQHWIIIIYEKILAPNSISLWTSPNFESLTFRHFFLLFFKLSHWTPSITSKFAGCWTLSVSFTTSISSTCSRIPRDTTWCSSRRHSTWLMIWSICSTTDHSGLSHLKIPSSPPSRPPYHPDGTSSATKIGVVKPITERERISGRSWKVTCRQVIHFNLLRFYWICLIRWRSHIEFFN